MSTALSQPVRSVTNRKPQNKSARAAGVGSAARIVRFLSIANLTAVSAVWVLITQVSERWWVSCALTYLPRIPYVIPSLILAVCAFRWRPRLIWVNLAAAGLAVGPVAGLRLPSLWQTTAPASTLTLRVLSCNIQEYEPAFPTVLQEISAFHPDVVAFQEISSENGLLLAYFQDWHTLHVDEFWIASEYPIRLIGTCESAAFGNLTAVKVEVSTPAGPVLLSNVHQMTARHALSGLRSVETLLNGKGPRGIERMTRLRDEEARRTRAFVMDGAPSAPALIVGDFNMPVSSHLYQTHWGDLANAFEVAGFGFGYTSPCDNHRLWPDQCPWLRIDHILSTEHWNVLKCRVGTQNGSDHHMIVATLTLRNGG